MTEKYFKSLNYSLGNEDTTFEVEMVKKLNPKKVLAVAGSGGRSLPLLCHGPSDLYCVDLSKEQIHLTELRSSCYKEFSLEDYLLFWGYPPYEPEDNTRKRNTLFNELELSNDCKHFFSRLYDEINWISPLYLGKWEKTFQVVAKIIKKIMGSQHDKLFEFSTIEDQMNYYKRDFPHLRWRFLVFLMGNKSFFNALLYKGHFIEKNVEESHFQYYLNNFDHLINNIVAKESFFLQLVFLGKVMTKEGIPIEADPSVFDDIKRSLNEGNASVHLEQKDIFELVKEIDNIDFFSFSDVPSYFTGNIEKNFLQNIKPCLSANSIVVLRYYLRVSEVDETGYEDVTKDYKDLIRKEKVGMYRIKILKNIS